MKITDWEAKIRNAKKPVLVEFWAPWCGPCKIMEPRLTQAASHYNGEVELLRVNADQSPEIIQKMNVMGIPTMVAFANGEEVFRRVGLQSDQALTEVFRAAAQVRRPEFHLSVRDRTLRGVLGLVVTTIGLVIGPNYLVVAMGGVLLFSAVYDRCPIYRAVAAKLNSFFAPKQSRQA